MKKCLFSILLFFVSLFGFPQKADFVLFNGKILTLKERGGSAQAVDVKADKIIAFWGKRPNQEFHYEEN